MSNSTTNITPTTQAEYRTFFTTLMNVVKVPEEVLEFVFQRCNYSCDENASGNGNGDDDNAMTETPYIDALGDLLCESLYKAWQNYARFLLNHGADPNYKEQRLSGAGSTPLMFAAQMSNVKVAKILLEFGSDPSIKNRNGSTWASFSANSETCHTINNWRSLKRAEEAEAKYETLANQYQEVNQKLDHLTQYLERLNVTPPSELPHKRSKGN